MRLICQICGEFIGEVSLEGVEESPGRAAIQPLKRPLLGSMVGSPDPFHGVPAPFDPSVTWEYWYCPYSNRTHWPFENTGVEPTQLLTHKGMIDIPNADGETTATDDFSEIIPIKEDTGRKVIKRRRRRRVNENV